MKFNILPDNKDLEVVVSSWWIACSIKDCRLFLISVGVLSGGGGGWLWTPIQIRATNGHSVILWGTILINCTGQDFSIISPRIVVPLFKWGIS